MWNIGKIPETWPFNCASEVAEFHQNWTQSVHFSVWTVNTVSVRWVSRMLTPNCTHISEELLNRYRRDPATQQKFRSQLVIQDETCIHNFDSELEQQSMQWNERIGQNSHFITLRNTGFSMSNANNRWPLVQKSYCAYRVLSLATTRIISKYYFNFILNRTRPGRELFDHPLNKLPQWGPGRSPAAKSFRAFWVGQVSSMQSCYAKLCITSW